MSTLQASDRTATIRTRAGTQAGNETLEAALTMVLFLGLLFLILDISMAVFIKGSLQTAVEAGARTAITENLGNASYLNDAIINSVAANSKGFLTRHTTACNLSIQYFDPVQGAYVTNLQSNDNTIVIVSLSGYKYSAMGPVLQGWGYQGAGYSTPMPLSIGATATGVLQPCPNGNCPNTANPSPPSCP